ncbi:MAG: NAD(P)/FAD-dependent oxidoreductase [Acidobacteriota bacterium]
MNTTDSDSPHVVILGGGFGGLRAARDLADTAARITLVDASNHHLFQPLLYQVASAGLSPADIASPIRKLLRRHRRVHVLLAKAKSIDLAKRRVLLDRGELDYDHLIIATGVTHSYFGNDGWAEHAPGLKSLDDAVEIRQRVLLAFERAEMETDEARRRALLTFIVVGGGPTGVELAGALAELSRHALARDFRRIDPRQARVLLCEGSPRLLGSFHETLSEEARRRLVVLGVEVRLGERIERIDETGVRLGDEDIDASTVVWAAGVGGDSLAASLGVPLDRAGRVLVEDDLSLPGHPEAFVIGDLASLNQEDGSPVPGVAPAAIQMGQHVAAGLRREWHGGERRPFRYHDKGSMATIGRAAAVVEHGDLRLSGYPAWWAWLALHLWFLIGFRNRLVVLFQWAWAYFTYQRGARLITGAAEDEGDAS